MLEKWKSENNCLSAPAHLLMYKPDQGKSSCLSWLNPQLPIICYSKIISVLIKKPITPRLVQTTNMMFRVFAAVTPSGLFPF